MEIIQKYKDQITDSFKSLQENGIIPNDQSLNVGEAEESSRSTDPTDHSSQKSAYERSEQEQIQSCVLEENPYRQKYVQSDRFIKNPQTNKCIVCGKQQPKYRCPQCLIPFCSSQHYKTHNLYCSEGFFKTQVEHKLKGMKSEKEDRKKVIELLHEHNSLKEQPFESMCQNNQISEDRLLQILRKIQEYESQVSCSFKNKLFAQHLNRQKNQTDKKSSSQDSLQSLLKLNQHEEELFRKYIEDLQLQERLTCDKQQKGQSKQQGSKYFANTPFWDVSDGLDFYFLQQIDIEEYSESENPEIIATREVFSRKFHEEVEALSIFHEQSFLQVHRKPTCQDEIQQQNKPNSKLLRPSQLVQWEVLQHLIIGTALHGVFNFEVEEVSIRNEFAQLYQQIQITDICLKIQGYFSSQQNLPNKTEQIGSLVISLLRNNLEHLRSKSSGSLKESLQLTCTWFERVLIGRECRKIVKNNFLLVELLMRNLEIFKGIYPIDMKKYHQLKNQQQKVSGETGDRKKQEKENSCLLKQNLNNSIRQIKKLEYLLAFVKGHLRSKSKRGTAGFYDLFSNLSRVLEAECIRQQNSNSDQSKSGDYDRRQEVANIEKKY